jgi:hypothetical protein
MPRLATYCLPIVTLLFVLNQAGASDLPTLRDYDQASRSEDRHKIQYLQSYIAGAVDTHLHYAKRLKNWTRLKTLCPGKSKLSSQELGSIFQLKAMSLKRRYGRDIMGMPIVEVVPMIVEEHYRCF